MSGHPRDCDCPNCTGDHPDAGGKSYYRPPSSPSEAATCKQSLQVGSAEELAKKVTAMRDFYRQRPALDETRAHLSSLYMGIAECKRIADLLDEAAALLRKQEEEKREWKEQVHRYSDELSASQARVAELEAEVDELDQGGMSLAAKFSAAQEALKRIDAFALDGAGQAYVAHHAGEEYAFKAISRISRAALAEEKGNDGT